MPYQQDDEIELSLLDIFNIIWKRRGLIFLLTFLFGAAATGYAFYAPFIYRAECRILPPGNRGAAGAIAAQLGGLADFAGLSVGSSAGQMLIGIIKGDSIVDAIINKFNLMEEYKQEIRLNARRSTLANLETDEDAKSGIVSVAFIDKDPQKAADIANAFVNELQKKLTEMSISSAQERREFFENQLAQAQQELSDAENAMMKYQQSSGVLALGSQTAAILGAIASLRNQIAAKNVEISSLSSYTRKDNPRLRLAQSQLEAMTKELRRLEEEQRRTDDSNTRHGRALSSDLLASVGHVPELSVENQRYERALRLAAAKYETMMRQYENARLNEASDISTVQIVDPATPPDWKYKPQRAKIMIIGTMAGFVLGVFWAFFAYSIMKMKEENEEKEYYDD